MNSETFSIKKMTVDHLIKKVQVYVKCYLSARESVQLYKAYQKLDYDKVKKILVKTVNEIGKTKENLKEILSQIDDIKENLSGIDNKMTYIGNHAQETLNNFSDELDAIAEENIKKERSGKNNKMGQSVDIAFAVIILAIIVFVILGVCQRQRKGNKRAKEVLSLPSNKKRKPSNHIEYTQKDRDMINLIQELSEVYQKTDEYMKH